jgi:rhamnosyltransferase
VKASVVIPTHNGGSLFKSVISSLFHQDFTDEWEIVVIDSESNDGTYEFLENCTLESPVKLKLLKTKKSEFKHGPSRNRAIRACRGEFVALITQDSIPFDENWLECLIQGFDESDSVAGVFGAHLAHVRHAEVIKLEMKNHFNIMNSKILRTSKEWRESENDIRNRQILHFFSNNNSAIRRSTWGNFPFPPVNYGEDQVWARIILEAGYSIRYQESAKVRHSHMFGFMDTYKRMKTEKRFFLRYFGYDLHHDCRKTMLSVTKKIISEMFISLKNGEFPVVYILKRNLSRLLLSLTNP